MQCRGAVGLTLIHVLMRGQQGPQSLAVPRLGGLHQTIREIRPAAAGATSTGITRTNRERAHTADTMVGP